LKMESPNARMDEDLLCLVHSDGHVRLVVEDRFHVVAGDSDKFIQDPFGGLCVVGSVFMVVDSVTVDVIGRMVEGLAKLGK